MSKELVHRAIRGTSGFLMLAGVGIGAQAYPQHVAANSIGNLVQYSHEMDKSYPPNQQELATQQLMSSELQGDLALQADFSEVGGVLLGLGVAGLVSSMAYRRKSEVKPELNTQETCA